MPLIRKYVDARLFPVYLTSFFVSLHYFLVIYINSAYLARYIDDAHISLFYLFGSVLGIALFSYFVRALRRVGNYHLMVIFILLEALSLLGLGFGTDFAVVIVSFMLHIAVSPVIYLNLDVFLEKLTRDERVTGSIRGTFLTVQNIALVVCPLLTGLLLTQGDYWKVYAVSMAFLFASLAIAVSQLRHFNDPRYHPSTLLQTFGYVLRHKVLYRVFAAQSLLRFFYAWMVIYTPLYLVRNVGFSWQEIGFLFSIMLLPFLLFELPLGRLADKRGEQGILIAGFIIMALTVAAMPLFPKPDFVAWAVILFLSRLGASMTEIATESHFFKHVDSSLADTISLFRVTRPLTYIAATLIAALTLQFIPLQWSFVVLAAFMLWGLRYAFALKNTK